MGYRESEFWNGIALKALHEGEMTIYKRDPVYGSVPDIARSGVFRRSIGEPKGQIADWRFTMPWDTRSVHAVEFIDRYEIHVDKYDPGKHPLMHLINDSPKYASLLLPLIAVFPILVLRKKLKI